MNLNQLIRLNRALSLGVRRFRWRLIFAKRMLCRNQNSQIAWGLLV
jgi:hypothetical protein